MDTSVQEYDGASHTWITPADAVADTPASDLVETPTPDTAPVEAVAEPKVGKPRNDPRARMADATAKEAAAKRERDEAKAEAAKLQARIAELEARSTPKPSPRVQQGTGDDPEPTLDGVDASGRPLFDNYEKFVKAQARWEARQEIRQQEESRQKHETQQLEEHAHREVNDAFYERYGRVVDQEPDFAKRLLPSLVNTVRFGMLSPEERKNATVASLIMEEVFHSEHPREVLLYASDPANSQRLATLPPTQLRRELARVDLGAASPTGPAPTVQAISHAKPPIKPVGSSPLVSNDEPSDEDSDDEWLRKENAKLLRARRAGRG